MQMNTGTPDLEVPQPKRYSVGTLTYTLPGLIALMGWLLWGDFCFTLMESVFPTVLPIKLKQLDAPSWIIGLIITGIPGLLNATVCPAVSFLSDRHRSKLGRRIPFILYTIPFLSLFLALLGLAGPISSLAAKQGWVGDPKFLALTLCALFTIGFQFFNMFVASVYYYLFNDVVPHQFLGRFMAAFRVVGTLSSSAFSFFIFPHSSTHFTEVFLGVSILYGIAFFLMCRFVKEGEYPPPPEMTAQSRSAVVAGIKTFFVESFSNPFYWLFFIWTSAGAAAGTIMVFQIFFAQSLGLSLTQIGNFTGTSGLIIAALMIPCGFLSDRFHPVRIMRVASILLPIANLAPLVFLFVNVPPQLAFLAWCLSYGMTVPVLALYFTAELPSYMQILPQERYGQFCSANAMVRSLTAMVAGVVAGLALDIIKPLCANPDHAYRFIPIWVVALQIVSAISFWLLHAGWKRRGGRENYKPPSV